MTPLSTTNMEPMSYHMNRLSTFSDFPSTSSISCIRLAENGFYYTGISDKVKCFSCNVGYSNWTETDIPSEIHTRLSPNCRMVNDRKTKSQQGICPGNPRKDNNTGDAVIEIYSMTRPTKGKAIIINNEQFRKDPHNPLSIPLVHRDGTQKDAEKLQQLWNRLQFRVDIYNNLNKEGILRTAYEISKLDHSDFDCLVFCILTHGGFGFLYGVDGMMVETRDIVELFQSIECPSLAGKPKMFFIQACQGSSSQKGIEMLRSDGTPMAFDGQNISKTDTIPTEADFLLSFSTVPGFVSYRCPINGTWYINSLCDHISKYLDRYDLLTILTMINADVSKKEKREGNTTYKQMPIHKSTLCKHVYLHHC